MKLIITVLVLLSVGYQISKLTFLRKDEGMKNTVYKYRVDSDYRDELDLKSFYEVTNGTTIAVGEGYYPELEKYHTRWVATKSIDGASWTLHWSMVAKDAEWIRHNGNSATLEQVRTLVSATEEVYQLYIQSEE